MTGMLAEGFLVSLQIFAFTLLGSLPLGMLVAFARMSRVKPLALLARFYISIMRGTPLMLQMFAIYFVPYYVFGISLTTDSKWYATIVAFIVNYAAYFAEIYRFGVIEMFTVAKQLVASQVSMLPFAIAAAFYWIFNLLVDFVAGQIKRKLSYYHD